MDIWLVLFVSAAFVSVAGLTFSVGHLVTSRNRLQRRLPADREHVGLADADARATTLARWSGSPSPGVRSASARESRKELRLKLVRAGYFSPHAIRSYVFARVCAVVVVPSLVLLSCLLLLQDLSTFKLMLAAAASVGVGVLGPDAYLSRRQSWQIAEYRLNFPDLLDLLTVCVTAGLTVEASFERIRDRLEQAKPRAWSQHRIDGRRDARGKKLG